MNPNTLIQVRKIVLATIIVFACAILLWIVSRPLTPEQALENRAQRFIEIATAFAGESPEDIDMYWGPESLNNSGNGGQSSAETLIVEATELLAEMTGESPSPRERNLRSRLDQLQSLLDVASQADKPTFEEEMQLLYGISTPPESTLDQQKELDTLEELLPGRGTLAFRIAAYRNRMLIPADKRRAVFEAALAECKRRSQDIRAIPEFENIEINWSRDTQAAWHTYLGQGRSRLTLNDLSLAFLDSAVEVACHEAYPGHHLQYVLREEKAGSAGLNIEEKLVLLRSPESILLEGAANLAADMVFPPQERLSFEHEVLANIAGITPPEKEQTLAIQASIKKLEAAVMPIVQQYYDGEIAFNTATFRLEKEAVLSSPSALLEYVDKFGTYTAGYTFAEEILREHISQLGSMTARWNRLREIITTPTESAALLFDINTEY